MEIQQQAHGAVTVLRPGGPILEPDADQFKNTTLEAITRNLGRVVVDASAVAFLDSRGIEVLVDVTDELSQSGRALKLCAANATVRQVLELTGLSDTFEFYDDVNTGVRSFL